MKIETKAYRSGSHVGRLVWRGRYRITELGTGLDVGWTLATNGAGLPIAYENREAAEAGARICAQSFATRFPDHAIEDMVDPEGDDWGDS